MSLQSNYLSVICVKIPQLPKYSFVFKWTQFHIIVEEQFLLYKVDVGCFSTDVSGSVHRAFAEVWTCGSTAQGYAVIADGNGCAYYSLQVVSSCLLGEDKF